MTLTFPHKKDEALSMDVDYLERFPIPDVAENAKEAIRDRCRSLVELALGRRGRSRERLALERELSSLVWRAYGLSSSDEGILDELPVARDPLRVLMTDKTADEPLEHGTRSDDEPT